MGHNMTASIESVLTDSIFYAGSTQQLQMPMSVRSASSETLCRSCWVQSRCCGGWRRCGGCPSCTPSPMTSSPHLPGVWRFVSLLQRMLSSPWVIQVRSATTIKLAVIKIRDKVPYGTNGLESNQERQPHFGVHCMRLYHILA